MIRNQEIREDLQQPPIEKRLAQRQLRWLSRMVEDRKPRQFFEARPDGGRPRGRPRVTYEICIEEMERKVSKSMAELKRMAQDRKKWKSFSEDPQTLISN